MASAGAAGISPSEGAAAKAADAWCQCDNPNCNKWRRLPPGTEVDENNDWYCYMNPDPERNTCEAPEEEYAQEAEEESESELEALQRQQQASRRKSQRSRGRGGKGRGGGRGRAKRGAGSQEYGSEPGAKRQRLGPSRLGMAPKEENDLDDYDQGRAGKPRGAMKLRRAHQGFEKVMGRGGVWEIVKGKGRAVTLPPHWLWEGLATYTPAAAEVACHAVDMASAAKYFEAVSEAAGEQSRAAQQASRLALASAAAMASLGTRALVAGVEGRPPMPPPPQSSASPAAASQPELNSPAGPSSAAGSQPAWQARLAASAAGASPAAASSPQPQQLPLQHQQQPQLRPPLTHVAAASPSGQAHQPLMQRQQQRQQQQQQQQHQLQPSSAPRSSLPGPVASTLRRDYEPAAVQQGGAGDAVNGAAVVQPAVVQSAAHGNRPGGVIPAGGSHTSQPHASVQQPVATQGVSPSKLVTGTAGQQHALGGSNGCRGQQNAGLKQAAVIPINGLSHQPQGGGMVHASASSQGGQPRTGS